MTIPCYSWSEKIPESGVTVLVKVAHVRLCRSRMFSRETQEMVFDDNDRTWRSPIMGAPQVAGLLGTTYAQVVLENHEQAFCRM